jgi:hypothetical protein
MTHFDALLKKRFEHKVPRVKAHWLSLSAFSSSSRVCVTANWVNKSRVRAYHYDSRARCPHEFLVADCLNFSLFARKISSHLSSLCRHPLNHAVIYLSHWLLSY